MELYRLNNLSHFIRYYFYRHTYFNESTIKTKVAFDSLLDHLRNEPETLPIQMFELSELQNMITDDDDKEVFSRMVFPRLKSAQHFDMMKVGENKNEQMVVRFTILDKFGSTYTQRIPIEPREIGQLYQLFFRENYPKEIGDADNHFVVSDINEKIIGGLTWKYFDKENILLDGIVVGSALQGRGIASSMIENFFTAMEARGVKVIKAHFLFGNYYLKHYFKVDKRWGALIKTLNE